MKEYSGRFFWWREEQDEWSEMVEIVACGHCVNDSAQRIPARINDYNLFDVENITCDLCGHYFERKEDSGDPITWVDYGVSGNEIVFVDGSEDFHADG